MFLAGRAKFFQHVKPEICLFAELKITKRQQRFYLLVKGE